MLVGFELPDFGHLVEELLRVMLYLDLALVHELGGEGEPEDACHARITPDLSIIRLGKGVRELLEGMGLGGVSSMICAREGPSMEEAIA